MQERRPGEATRTGMDRLEPSEATVLQEALYELGVERCAYELRVSGATLIKAAARLRVTATVTTTIRAALQPGRFGLLEG